MANTMAARGLRAHLAPLLAIGTAGERARNSAAIRGHPGQASRLLPATTPVDRFASKSADLTRERSSARPQASAAAKRLLDGRAANKGPSRVAMFALGGEIDLVTPEATASCTGAACSSSLPKHAGLTTTRQTSPPQPALAQ